MAGIWPNLDASDLETRIRYYLNEASASFYTQAEIWKWLGQAARDISKSTLCVRRILTTTTTANSRNVTTNAYKVMHVEYIPSSGRSIILPKIDPLNASHCKLNYGIVPQYWYEFGDAIGIEPVPTTTYNLRLYIVDVAKLVSQPAWSAYTAGARWVVGDSIIHSGASSDIILTAGISNSTNYTFEFHVSGIGATGSLKLTCGTLEGSTITTNGYHCQSFVSNGTTFKLTGVNDVTVNWLKIYKEDNIAAVTDQTELNPEWSTTLAIYATYQGLMKDKKIEQAMLLYNIYQNDFNYLSQKIIEVIPDPKDSLNFK